MELLKKNIHMDRVGAEAAVQMTLEDDINIPENKPDVNSLNLEKGVVVTEEIKPGMDSVTVRGKLCFSILYHTKESGGKLILLEGKIPFEEKIHMEGVVSSDTVQVEAELEDLTVNMINSRKLNVQSLITLNAWVEEIYDEEVPIGIQGEEAVEYRKSPVTLARIAISKNDIFRLKEEVSLPSGYPNVFQILWNHICLGDVEFKVMEEKLTLQGDIHFFILYEGEGEEHPIRSFETMLPFGGILECHGCRDGMLPDIRYHLSQQELTIRPDFDGEERNVGMELVLDISIRLYEEEKTELVSDIYGVSREIEAVTGEAGLRRLLARVTGKTKLTEHIRVTKGDAPVLQLLHCEGSVVPEGQEAVENGILLRGSLLLKTLYITGDDEAPYGSSQTQLPYQYTLEVPDIAPGDLSKVRGSVEQLQVAMLDGEEMDVKAVLSFSTTVFQNVPVNLISQVTVREPDREKMNSLPGMVIYAVKEGDNLWNIGRKYYVPVDSLREWNNLTGDELKPGQKLLVVRGG